LNKTFCHNTLNTNAGSPQKALTIKRLKVIEHFIPFDAHFALLILEANLSARRVERYFLPLSLKLLNCSNKITHKFSTKPHR
jgi:hypothetical protein